MDFQVEAIAATQEMDGIRSTDPEHVFFDSFIDEEVMAAVEALPREFREAVVLGDIEGLSYNEIAEVLDVPIGTVKSRLYRGRRQLARALRDYGLTMGYLREGGP
jgi:RNA polymerase sigma-70 factor (ECF subfamily)